MECFISLPNSTVFDIVVNSKGKGQQCMDTICKHLGIVEQDYFGLQYRSSKGENLWLNLRNKLDRQLLGPAPYRLQFRVKFYIQPHNLQQPGTKQLFYDQVKLDFEHQKLVPESEDQAKQLVALISQADHGMFERRTHQLNMYKCVLGLVARDFDPAHDFIHSILDTHIQLGDLSKESAQYQVLQLAAGLQNYGMEFHESSSDSDVTQVGIGPVGVVLFNSNMDVVERLTYPTIHKAEHNGKVNTLKLLNDNGTSRDLEFRHTSQNTANSMYRCITEMHSFFWCDTVHTEVSTQFCRDLKGTLASIFYEKTKLGLDYVFDIQRTSREALDHTRRALYQASLTQEEQEEAQIEDVDNSDCDIHTPGAEERCHVLEETIVRISETYTCCVCRDNELSAVLVPCGHPTCYDCAKQLTDCPMCRRKIDSVQRLFLPAIQCEGAMCASSVSLKTAKSPLHSHRLCQKRKRDQSVDSTSRPKT
ncbi:MYLIB-like protein [Mya arenaria]|uniref:MYLIB-like protein n=1 Tax=Mya arenaria TaxID=6604 RepID=A0ABY7ETR6_MYAAR|nr:E3 ubiquitin-protein ligase MYLIP-like [Mya arenaria]WAR13370.1 MYLIB-like protein [Mya arenaria]